MRSDRYGAAALDRAGLGERERLLVSFVDELCGSRTVSEATFVAVHRLLGVDLSIHCAGLDRGDETAEPNWIAARFSRPAAAQKVAPYSAVPRRSSSRPGSG